MIATSFWMTSDGVKMLDATAKHMRASRVAVICQVISWVNNFRELARPRISWLKEHRERVSVTKTRVKVSARVHPEVHARLLDLAGSYGVPASVVLEGGLWAFLKSSQWLVPALPHIQEDPPAEGEGTEVQ